MKIKRTIPKKTASKEGNVGGCDAWLHPEVFDEDWEKHTDRHILRLLKDVDKSLYIDLSKSEPPKPPKTGRRIDRSRLVKRPVQVRGKNGKMYVRMQWVDPHTGMPPEHHSSVEQDHKPVKTFTPQPHPDYKQPTFATKPVSDRNPEDMTRDEFVDYYVRKKMSREDKYDMINNHKIQWDRNDHPNIDHKNAVSALKQFLRENPHLIGADHLPVERDVKSAVGTDSPNEYCDLWKNDPEGLYDVMKKLNIIGEDEGDPRLADPDDKTAPVKHMLNMMKLKKYLKENPHIMQNPEFLPKNLVTDKKKILDDESKGVKPSVAQKGGNDIDGILKNMSAEEVYDLMKHLGIADHDPRLVPGKQPKSKGGNGKGAIEHMLNMMKLKKQIALDPSVLTKRGHNLAQEEKERIASLKGDAKKEEEIKAFVKDMTDDLIEEAIDHLKHNNHVKNRVTTKNENINRMHKRTAIQKAFIENPDLMVQYKRDVRNNRLMSMRIGNKLMAKFLREVGGYKGLGDLKRPEDEEFKDIEWIFWEDSSARFEINDMGKAVLSVIDTGKDGTEWNEREFDLQEVKNFIDGIRSGKKNKEKPQPIDKPLHSRPIGDIEDALSKDFDSNFTPEVENVVRKHLADAWIAGGKKSLISSIRSEGLNVSPKFYSDNTIYNVLSKWGIDHDSDLGAFKSVSDGWLKNAYKDEIEQGKTKTKSAIEYLDMGTVGSGRTNPVVLHEVAKNWTPEERSTARKEVIDDSFDIPTQDSFEDGDKRRKKLIDHFHDALEHVPFDLMTHAFARGLRVSIHDKNHFDDPMTGAYFYRRENEIRLDHAYFKDDSVFSDHFFDHKPEDSPHPNNPNAKYGHWNFGETVVHEFGHATDYFLGDNKKYRLWHGEIGSKYVPEEHHDVIGDSYLKAVKKSNPDFELAWHRNAKGDRSFIYVKDEWMTTYEGRVYGNYEKLDRDLIRMDDDTGRMYDKDMLGTYGDHGAEHWAESVSRYCNAQHAYKKFRQENPNTYYETMDDWAHYMYNMHHVEGYGTEHEVNDPFSGSNKGYKNALNSKPGQAYGWAYHKMKQLHPEITKAIKDIFDRGDFIDQKEQGRTERLNQGKFTRKSIDLIVER